MSDNDQTQLERVLTGLSWWSGPTPDTWKTALNRADADPGPTWVTRALRSPWPWVAVPVAAIVVVAIGIAFSESSQSGVGSHSLLYEISSADLDVGADLLAEATRSSARLHTAALDLSLFSSAPGTLGQGRGQVLQRRASDAKPQWLGNVGAQVVAEPGERVKSTVLTPRASSLSPVIASYASPDETTGSQQQMAVVLGPPNVARFVTNSATLSQVRAAAQRASGSNGESLPPGGRHVVRKVSMDLEADDVRGVYFKIVQMVLSQADGEFVERSELHGRGPQTTAYVTLRVRGDRLSATLATLRGLAEVLREQTNSTDVTAQVVDTEARLRNEQRVEQELLALMDKRKDAALEELLKVGEVLAQVRGRIERLVAERQRVGRQVALATVVVSIRSKAAPAKEAVGLGGQLRTEMRDAWRGGVSFLIRTVAAFVSVLIGGLVWWVALCVAVWLGRRRYLRRLAARDSPDA